MHSDQPSRFFSPWDFASLAGLAGLAAFYERILPLLPDPVPSKFTSLGQACGWTPKAQLPWLVFLPPVFVWLVVFLVGAATALLPRGAGRPLQVPVHPLRGLMGLGMCLLLAGCLLTALRGLTALFSGVLGFGVCLLLGLVFLARDTWQAIARAPVSEHYRCGVFYVNRQDPRLWVPKRVGYGWTVNFAHPAAGWVMALLAAATAAVVAGVTLLTRR